MPACRPPAGVAAKVATWSPSSQRTPRGFPKPQERSISDRLWIAARSPLRAIRRRTVGEAVLALIVAFRLKTIWRELLTASGQRRLTHVAVEVKDDTELNIVVK